MLRCSWRDMQILGWELRDRSGSMDFIDEAVLFMLGEH